MEWVAVGMRAPPLAVAQRKALPRLRWHFADGSQMKWKSYFRDGYLVRCGPWGIWRWCESRHVDTKQNHRWRKLVFVTSPAIWWPRRKFANSHRSIDSCVCVCVWRCAENWEDAHTYIDNETLLTRSACWRRSELAQSVVTGKIKSWLSFPVFHMSPSIHFYTYAWILRWKPKQRRLLDAHIMILSSHIGFLLLSLLLVVFLLRCFCITQLLFVRIAASRCCSCFFVYCNIPHYMH